MPTLKRTGSGALAVTLDADPNTGIILKEVLLTLSDDSAKLEFLTITVDSAAGSEYDNEFSRHKMQDVHDLACLDINKRILPLDKFDFAWPNSDSKTWGLEVVYDTYC